MIKCLAGVVALVCALGFVSDAQAQVICSKTSNKGKTKFKLRDVCKSNEVVAQDFGTLVPADVVTEGDLPAPPGQLATLADIPVLPTDHVALGDLPAAPGQLATVAQIPVVRQTEVYHTVNGSNQTDNVDVLLDLGGAAGDTYSFPTTAASTDVVIHFTAECGHSSGSTPEWVHIDLSLDGAVLPPTDHATKEDALCTSDGSGNFNYTRTSVTSVVEDVPAGNHSVQILAGIGFGTGSWWIGDLSLVVITHED
jgi:hypothetical protein